MGQRKYGYDVIRALVILVVFLHHILNRQPFNSYLLASIYACGTIGMSLLGFLSASLLSPKEEDYGSFLLKRFSRIYLPLFLCLGAVLILHTLIGKVIISQHTLLHVMGLTLFFKLLGVKANSTIGHGLWFVTIIIVMYLILPLLKFLFNHPNRLGHLVGIVLLFTGLDYVLWGSENAWNVAVGFTVGVYLSISGRQGDVFGRIKPIQGVMASLALVALTALSLRGDFLFPVHKLFYVLYPIAFIPILMSLADRLPIIFQKGFIVFSTLSFEFYILHFYFVNEGYRDFFPVSISLIDQIIISFLTTLLLAYIFSRIASLLREKVLFYLLKNPQ
jgi:hypothetical protein